MNSEISSTSRREAQQAFGSVGEYSYMVTVSQSPSGLEQSPGGPQYVGKGKSPHHAELQGVLHPPAVAQAFPSSIHSGNCSTNFHADGGHVTEAGGDTCMFSWAGDGWLGWETPRHNPTMGCLNSKRQEKPGWGLQSTEAWPPTGGSYEGGPSSAACGRGQVR